MSLLRSIFGPSKAEIWSQVAADIGGEYRDGGWFTKDAVVYRHGEWQIVLDTYTTSSGSGSNRSSRTYTRMRAPFVNQDGLHFKIYREGLFSPLGRWLGMQDLVIGHPTFDQRYVIKGNDEHQIRRLLDDDELRRLFEYQPEIEIEIRDDEGWFGADFPDGCDQLYFACYGVIRDPSVLEDLFTLFARLLERLVAIDSAYETDPGVQLV